MTAFCHGELLIENESRREKKLALEEEIRNAIQHYRETGGEEKEILTLIVDLAAKYSSDLASTWRLAAMIVQESVNVKE